MLIKDIMTKDVITAPSSMPVTEAKKIMKENHFRRMPVVDDGKLVGVVNESRLEEVSPKSSTPLVWQVAYVLSHTTLRDVMEKRVVTIKPSATVEQGVALAQRERVGSLVVADKGKVLGLVTTNDFFYRIVNPVLGIGEEGSRILISGAGDGKMAEKALECINKMGLEVKVIWTVKPTKTSRKSDLIIHVDSEDVTQTLEELQKLGLSASVRARDI